MEHLKSGSAVIQASKVGKWCIFTNLRGSNMLDLSAHACYIITEIPTGIGFDSAQFRVDFPVVFYERLLSDRYGKKSRLFIVYDEEIELIFV